MPSDFNHIDEFFRKKEEEAAAPDHLQDRHWAQMKETLSNIPANLPVAKKAWLSKTAGLTGFILATSATFIFIIYKYTEAVPDKAPGKTQATAIVDQRSFTAAKDSFPIKKHLVVKQDTIRVKTHKINIQKNGIHLIEDSISQPILRLEIQDKKEITDAKEKKLFDSFFSELKKDAQVFEVQSSGDTTIYGKEGTALFIPANSFQTASGEIAPMVTVHIKEFYSIGDIIGNKLSTMSGDKPLVTGGMIHIEAFSEGKPVVVKKHSSLQLKMPASSFDPRMQLFTGSEINTLRPNTTMDTLFAGAGGVINWIAAGQQQSFYANNLKYIRIWNLRNNPVAVRYKHEFNPSKIKSVGEFRIPWNSAYTVEEIKSELIKRFGRYYDEIKVKKERRPWFAKKKTLDSLFVYEWYDSPFVGDTVTMHIRTATRLKYITREDSLRYEAAWKEETELAMKRNESYRQLVQLNTQYNFNISSLGWINCDRFLAYPSSSLTDFGFAVLKDFNETYFHSVLLFKKENVILKGYGGKGKISFGRIPKGTEVSVISVGVKNGKLYGCIRDLVVNDDPVSLEFTEMEPAEMKEQLKRFGTVGRRG